MYGDGKTTTHSHEAMGMMNAVKENLPLWRGRAKAALATLQADPHVDGSRLVSIGYCFGGATSLELAYSDANIIAAISFHGSLPLPSNKDIVKAEILVLTGAEDPFVKKEAVEELRKELSAKKANFKIVSYPDAKHGFTVKDAEKKGLDGLEYNEKADQESWQEMLKLFNRIF